MSTTFAIHKDGEEIIVATRRGVGNGRVEITWTNPVAPYLNKNTRVHAIDNSPQGIYTIGDIVKHNKVLYVNLEEWYESRYGRKFDKCYEYIRGMDEVPTPERTQYRPGDVVTVTEDNNEKVVGVVLGCIDNTTEELRTDAVGMVCFDHIRHSSKKELTMYRLGSKVLDWV